MKPVKHILVMTYWSFSDALIQTYTLPYLKLMAAQLSPDSRIILVTLEKDSIGIVKDEVTGILNVRFKYSPFSLSASVSWLKNIVSLRRLVKQYQVDFIHAFCTPAGMIGYILARLTAKPLILDSYEPHAEAMVENGEWQKNSWSYKILFYFEKKQTEHAYKIISATSGMKDYALEKYHIRLPQVFVKPACVNLESFDMKDKKDKQLMRELQLEGKVVCVYAGKFGGIYLKEEVFAFYKACYQTWKDDFVALILTNHSLVEIEDLIQQYQLPKSSFRIVFVSHALIPKYIGLGDFAITPVKPVNTKRYCTPIKNGEYWAMGLPVVITKNISVDSELIESHDIGYVIQELTMNEFLKATHKIDDLLKDPGLSLKIRQIAEQERNFSIAEKVYRIIYA